MKNLLSLFAALSIGAAGCSQAPTSQGVVTAPVGSNMAQPLSAPDSTDAHSRNWRMSDGFNNDPQQL